MQRAGAAMCFLWLVSTLGIATAGFATTLAVAPLGAGQAAPELLQRMVGTWDVQQKMWPGANATAIILPPAVAKRQLVGNTYLKETMQLEPGSKQSPFTRDAYFNYNAVTHRYEYASMDTRAPQLMVEKSDVTAEASTTPQRADTIALQGSRFLAPRWGNATNVSFRYRLTIGPVEHDRQTVRLYLTPLSGTTKKEFLAFEYVYTRRR